MGKTFLFRFELGDPSGFGLPPSRWRNDPSVCGCHGFLDDIALHRTQRAE